MAVKQFKFEDIAKLDGGAIAIAMDRLLRSVIEDCEDRPTIKTERKLILEVKLKPIADGKDLRDIALTFELNAKAPKKASMPYTMGFRKSSREGVMLIFNPDSTDYRQDSFDFKENN